MSLAAFAQEKPLAVSGWEQGALAQPWETFPAPTLGAAGVSGCSLGFEFPTKFTPNS